MDNQLTTDRPVPPSPNEGCCEAQRCRLTHVMAGVVAVDFWDSFREQHIRANLAPHQAYELQQDLTASVQELGILKPEPVSFGFGWALKQLGNGAKVARDGWNGKNMWLELQVPDENSKMTLPYLFLNYPPCGQYPSGARVPWLASQTDLLAGDWQVINHRPDIRSIGQLESKLAAEIAFRDKNLYSPPGTSRIG